MDSNCHVPEQVFQCLLYLDAHLALIKRPFIAQEDWSSCCIKSSSELWKTIIKCCWIRKTAINFEIIHSPVGKRLQQQNKTLESQLHLFISFILLEKIIGHVYVYQINFENKVPAKSKRNSCKLHL